MRKSLVTLIPCLAVSATWAATGLDTVATRVKTGLLTGAVNSANVAKYLASQSIVDGTWSDLDYSGTGASVWPAAQHPQRLQAMALAWAKPGSAWYGVDSVLARVRKGIEGYLAKNPRSANWWFNEIAEDLPWGQTLVLIKGAVPDTTLARWALRIDGVWTKWTGANLTDEGTAHIYRCIATNQPSGVDSVITAFRSSIQFVDVGDGLHRDFSYSQHGALHLIYNGGYGQTYLNGEISWWKLVDSTSFAFPSGKLDLLRAMALDGSAWMVHAGKWDVPAVGRDLTRGIQGAGGLATAARNLATGGVRVSELTAMADWVNGKASWPWPDHPDKYFWTCQYLSHHASGWMVSVRGVRKGVSGAESINGENLKGWFLPFGSTWIHVRGDEHDNIWPSFDWARVPGVTADRVDTFPASANNKGWGQNAGSTNFVGGVSDGKGGVLAYDYAVSGIVGKKSWFQTPDALVALGAGLVFDKPREVATSVDQRKARGVVTIGMADGSRTTLATDSLRGTGLRWIQHDSVGYWFPIAETLVVASRNQGGSWKAIDTSKQDAQVVQKVFSAWVDHGQKSSSSSYAYAVVPGVSADSMAKWVARSRVSIDANTPALQAVSESGWRGVTFFAAGKLIFADGVALSASAPCVVVVRDTTGGFVVTAADPSHALGSVDLVVSMAGISRSQTLVFPAAPNAGSSTKSVVAFPVSVLKSSVVESQLVRWSRADRRILVRGLPAGSAIVSLVDPGGKVLSRSKAKAGEVELETGSYVGSAYLVVQGVTRLVLRIPLMR